MVDYIVDFTSGIHEQRNNCQCPFCNREYLVAGLLPRKLPDNCAEGIPQQLNIWCFKCEKFVVPKRINHEHVS